jgi:hypothetical protein
MTPLLRTVGMGRGSAALTASSRTAAAFAQLAQALQRQAAGRTGAAAAPHLLAGQAGHGWLRPLALPDWADTTAIVSLTLALDASGPGAAPQLDIALADGIPGSALPRHWLLPGGVKLPLRAVRAARLQAQAGAHASSVPGLRRTTAPLLNGTATALVRDRLAIDRHYLLTCGHVVAPTAATRVDERVAVTLPGAAGGAAPLEGRLAEWLPPLGGQALRTDIDAALVELSRSDAVALARQGGLLAAGIGGAARLDAPVSLRRRSAPLAGALKIHWSGWVDLPALTPGVADYFLAGAVGYLAAAPTQAGDSGAALWDADERLMGMHLGAIPDAAAGSPNAVLAPIGPVLDWFHVQPWLRDDPATLAPQPMAPGRVAPPVLPADERLPGDAETIVAQTLWGEAAGEGRIGMEAVANVIRNRSDQQWRGKADEVAVCLDHKQFSCWNDGSPLLSRMERVQRQPDDAWRTAREVARLMLARRLSDRTQGATHYLASSLRQRPGWLQGAQLCCVIGRHEFFKGIR